MLEQADLLLPDLPMTAHLAPFVDADPLIFLSGQLAFDAQGQIEGDIGAQTRRCLQRCRDVLQGLGLDLHDVVKATAWLRHADDFAAFNAAYAEVFGAHKPARSTVVSALVIAAALVEIELIARRRSA